MKRIVVGISLCTGCVAATPPPIMPRHASPAPPDEGTLTLSLVTGLALASPFSGAIGGELRAAYQASTDVEIGLGLGIGRSDADVEPRTEAEAAAPLRNLTMLSLRAYSTTTPLETDHVAFTTGVGVLGLVGTGLVALTGDAGVTVGYANDTLVPYGSLVAAVAVPVRRGRAFGSGQRYTHPETAVYVGGFAGVGVPLGAHFLSLEGGYLKDVRSNHDSIIGGSIGERWSTE